MIARTGRWVEMVLDMLTVAVIVLVVGAMFVMTYDAGYEDGQEAGPTVTVELPREKLRWDR
jgi:hypothetical protein